MYKAAINPRASAPKLWAGTVTIHANAKTGAHHHGPGSVIYVVRAARAWGRHLEFTAEAISSTSALRAASGDQRQPHRRWTRPVPGDGRRWPSA
jgi:hypothetical protein